MTSLIGRNLGSYRVLATTQLGETGLVYKSLHIAKRQTFASEASARCLNRRESIADASSSINCAPPKLLTTRHIGRTYPIESADDLSIIPLEFVYGQNLSEKIAEGAPTADFMLRVALQTAEALQCAHAETPFMGD